MSAQKKEIRTLADALAKLRGAFSPGFGAFLLYTAFRQMSKSRRLPVPQVISAAGKAGAIGAEDAAVLAREGHDYLAVLQPPDHVRRRAVLVGERDDQRGARRVAFHDQRVANLSPHLDQSSALKAGALPGLGIPRSCQGIQAQHCPPARARAQRQPTRPAGTFGPPDPGQADQSTRCSPSPPQ